MTQIRKASFHSGQFGAAISLQVKSGGKKNSIKEIRSDGLVVVKLACKTVDASSHPLLVAFLATVLEVDQSKLDVVAGDQGEYKLISIVGIDSQRVEELLRSAAGKRD